MLDDLKFDWQDVSGLLGLPSNPHKTEVMIPCPACGGKRFAMNQAKGIGHCFSCGDFTANSLSYYAAVKGVSNGEAYREILHALGMEDDRQKELRDKARKERREREVMRQASQAQIAKIDVLDFTYRSFLSELTLSQKNRDNLLARGFSLQDIEMLGYKTFPNRSEVNFFDICKRLQLNGCKLEGVPGFYQAKSGAWTFVPLKQGIIIPQKTVNNKLFGFQIRKDDDLLSFDPETGKVEPKCTWFSSSGCRSGCGAQADVNFSCDFKFDQKTGKQWIYSQSKKVVLTEGTMKADLIHCFEPKIPCISVAGVNATTYLEHTLSYLKKLGIDTVILAYDMDYKTNKNVQNALLHTDQIIKDAGMELKKWEWDTHADVDGQSYEILKGLDDYLAYVKKGIVPKIKELD